MLSEEFEDRHRYQRYAKSQNPVATTWLISFEQISSHDPRAADLLKFLCFLGEKDIPISLLPVASKVQMREALGTLKAYAFITERGVPEAFDMHRLVRIVMRNWLRGKGELVKWHTDVVQRLYKEYPLPRHESRQTLTQYLPHGQAVLDISGASMTEEHLVLLFKMSKSYGMLGKYTEAERLQRQTIERCKEMFGREHTKTLLVMKNLSCIQAIQRGRSNSPADTRAKGKSVRQKAS